MRRIPAEFLSLFIVLVGCSPQGGLSPAGTGSGLSGSGYSATGGAAGGEGAAADQEDPPADVSGGDTVATTPATGEGGVQPTWAAPSPGSIECMAASLWAHVSLEGLASMDPQRLRFTLKYLTDEGREGLVFVGTPQWVDPRFAGPPRDLYAATDDLADSDPHRVNDRAPAAKGPWKAPGRSGDRLTGVYYVSKETPKTMTIADPTTITVILHPKVLGTTTCEQDLAWLRQAKLVLLGNYQKEGETFSRREEFSFPADSSNVELKDFILSRAAPAGD